MSIIRPRSYRYVSFLGLRYLILHTKNGDAFFPNPIGAYINADNTRVTVKCEDSCNSRSITLSQITGAVSCSANGEVIAGNLNM